MQGPDFSKEHAHLLLRLIMKAGVEPQEGLWLTQVLEEFDILRSRQIFRLDCEDISEALDYALRAGWIEQHDNKLFLTKLGFEKAGG